MSLGLRLSGILKTAKTLLLLNLGLKSHFPTCRVQCAVGGMQCVVIFTLK